MTILVSMVGALIVVVVLPPLQSAAERWSYQRDMWR